MNIKYKINVKSNDYLNVARRFADVTIGFDLKS